MSVAGSPAGLRNVAATLYRQARRTPDRTAIVLQQARQPDRAISYGELYAAASGAAGELVQAGIEPGEVVVLILNHGAPLVESFFGAVLAGAIPAIMPFLTEKLAPEPYRAGLAALFEITRPAGVVTYPEFVTEVQAARAGGAPRTVLVAGEAAGGQAPESAAAPLPGLDCDPDEIVLLQHSSGTTGLQKGVALSHRAVFNQLDAYAAALQLDDRDVVVSWLPLYHDMGLIAGFLMPILTGKPLVLMSPFDWVRAPARLLQAVSRYRGTLTWLPNFAYNFCAQKIRDRDLEGVDLSSWRAVINCSEPVLWSSHQRFIQRFQPYGLRPEAPATCYAMAENVFAVTQGGIAAPPVVDWVDGAGLVQRQEAIPADPQSPAALPMLSCGPALANTRLRVLDERGRDLPERRLGEIALQSDCMLTGYYHRPDLTEKGFLDGWFLTGDLGYLAGGELYVTGRKKDLIIVGGKNIYPQDLERLAGEVEGVHPGRVAAFGIFDEQAGTEEVVIVAESDLDEADCDRLAEAVRRRVTQGSDIALRRVKIVGRGWLLKTSSGKVARGANREKYLQEAGGGAE